MIDLSTQSEYSSSWDWTVKHSKYHFDNTRHDQAGEWFTPLGRFSGNWQEELQQAIDSDMEAITWATRKYSPYYDQPDGTRLQSGMLTQEEHDLKASGAPVDLALTDVVEATNFGPIFTAMREYFGLEDPWCRLHIQRPGQMFNLHIDKLWERAPDRPEDIFRMVVHLADWEPGQFYAYGTYTMSHWRAGEAHTFDWPNVPHATANASRSLRPTMIMTGLKTDRTRELLALATQDTVYTL
jgi:hypothetical protein